MNRVRKYVAGVLTVAVALAWVGCASVAKKRSDTVHLARLQTTAPDEVWSALRRAERLFHRGDHDGALEILEPIVRERPLFVPTTRLRQIILMNRGRAGLLWSEIADLDQRAPRRPEVEYLSTRLIPNLHERYERIEKAAREHPDSWWVQYAESWRRSRVGKREERSALVARLLTLSAHPVPWPGATVLIDGLMTTRGLPAFRPVLKRMADKYPDFAPLDLSRYRSGEDRLEFALRGLREAPEHLHAGRVLSQMAKSRTQSRAFARACLREPELVEKLVETGFGEALATVFKIGDSPDQAERVLDRMLATGRVQAAGRDRRWIFSPRREKIRLLVRRGDLESAIALFERALPPEIALDETNRIAPRVRALLAGPCRGVRGVPSSLTEARRVLRTLLEAGWVQECFDLGTSWLTFHPQLESEVDEADRFTRFETALVEWVTEFRGKRRLEEFLVDLRTASQSIFGRDVVGEPEILDFPLIGGKILDPFGPGLPRFMDRYNRHLIFGTLREPVRTPAMAFGRKVYERRLPIRPGMWVPGRAREVIVEDMRYSSASEVGFSEPAGIALWNHYVIDLRKWEEWVDDLERRWQRVGRGGAQALLDDPIPAANQLSMARPAQVSWKLLARRMFEARWTRDQLRAEVLELLRLHEHAHIVDAQRFLPAMQKIGPAVWLFARAGFSPEKLMAELEGRAEIAALAFGADPHLTLGHLANFICDPYVPDRSPHAWGFRRMLQRLLELWAADGAPGARHPDRNLFAQLHLLDGDRARRYARRILESVDF